MKRVCFAGVVAIAAFNFMGGLADAANTLVQFTTPSRNIGCIALNTSGAWDLRCDIREHSYRAPAQPSSCQEDYGDSLTLARTGRARWTCHGDTALPPANGYGFRTLRYGNSLRTGPFRCTSRVSGMTCTNASGRGFVISRERAGGLSP